MVTSIDIEVIGLAQHICHRYNPHIFFHFSTFTENAKKSSQENLPWQAEDQFGELRQAARKE